MSERESGVSQGRTTLQVCTYKYSAVWTYVLDKALK
jgi:hypothetical protein